jgi:two-component system chemotaxis response regulator CheB
MDRISKVAIMGSSFEGHEVASEVVVNMSIGPESVVIIIPHIFSGRVYESLLNRYRKVNPILDNQIIEPGNIYVGLENPNNTSQYSFYGLRRKLKIEKKNKDYFFKVGKEKIDGGYINESFNAVADTFKGKSIGIILYGMGGDGIDGLNRIKKKGGVAIAQKTNKEMPRVEMSMPYNAKRYCELDYVLSPKKLKEKLEELLR